MQKDDVAKIVRQGMKYNPQIKHELGCIVKIREMHEDAAEITVLTGAFPGGHGSIDLACLKWIPMSDLGNEATYMYKTTV